ncbi:hypothetical protein AVEN_200629-1 [Araneus ventricosus]|uniref:Integrase zinc-binding domain-containing protein n=1 Tax=Araneus ventricosus TaxID=182803 RepID=A0A4Y2SDP6_ARAVE|nr:hypothetical protein AVEN_200629-1 [Araneus ventricosus]
MKQQRGIDEESVLNEKRPQPVNALQVSDKNAEMSTLLDLSRFSLLPYKDQFSQLVILDSHNKLLHNGVEATLIQIREKFWIIKGRQCVKSTLNRCSLYKRYKVRPGTQETAPLPPDRVLMSPPFSMTGLDYAGPFFTKGSNDKHYLLLFTCATTRVLRLELVPSMTTL